MTGQKRRYITGAKNLGKTAIIREVASRCGFTLGDVRVIMNGIEELAYEAVAQNRVFKWKNLFSMYLVEIKGYDGWDQINKRPITIPTNRRVVLAPSKLLLRAGQTSMLSAEEKESISYFDAELPESGIVNLSPEDQESGEFSQEDIEPEEDWDEMVNED